MGSIFTRGMKLYMKYRDGSGAWRQKATGLDVGEEKRARAMLKEVERLIGSGEVIDGPPTGALTVSRYAKRWVTERKARGVSSAVDDESRFEHHVLPVLGSMQLGEVRPHHIRDLVRALKVKDAKFRQGKLAPRTVRQIFFTTRSMFQDAVVEELISANPCVLRRGELPPKVDKDPTWRRGAIFKSPEVQAIISDVRLPLDRRVMYSLLFLAGLRFGESAALRWSHYETDVTPLGRLLVAKSFSTRRREEKGTKTETAREVPVHPTLAKILEQWKAEGWSALMGRQPTADDLIIPSRIGTERNRAVNLGLERFHEDLKRLQLRPRRQHDARRTFITLGREGGANTDILRWVSHGRKSDIMDQYTEPSWESRCAAVLCIKVELLLPKALPEQAATSGGAVGPRVEAPASTSPAQELGAELGAVGSIDGAKNSEAPESTGDSGAPSWRAVRDSNFWTTSAAKRDGARPYLRLGPDLLLG